MPKPSPQKSPVQVEAAQPGAEAPELAEKPEVQQPAHRTFEEWAQAAGTATWLAAATRACKRWPVGKELTQQEFDEAVREAASIRIG